VSGYALWTLGRRGEAVFVGAFGSLSTERGCWGALGQAVVIGRGSVVDAKGDSSRAQIEVMLRADRERLAAAPPAPPPTPRPAPPPIVMPAPEPASAPPVAAEPEPPPVVDEPEPEAVPAVAAEAEGAEATAIDVDLGAEPPTHRVVPRRRRTAAPRREHSAPPADPWGDAEVTELLARVGAIVRRAGGLDALEHLVDGREQLLEGLR
jgi:hypothetical protein